MTYKRFEYIAYDGFTDNGEYITLYQVVDLLNKLYEESEDLTTKKEDVEYELLHLKEKYEELLEENERLKKDIEYYKMERRGLFEYIDKKDDLKLELKVEK